MEASLDFESDEMGETGYDVALMVNRQGPTPVYRTVQSAFPAYIGLRWEKYNLTSSQIYSTLNSNTQSGVK